MGCFRRLRQSAQVVKRGVSVCRPDKEGSGQSLWAVLGKEQSEKWSRVETDKVEPESWADCDMTVRRGRRR